MQLSHRPQAVSARFDDPNLVSAAGLVPVAALAVAAGLRNLADELCPTTIAVESVLVARVILHLGRRTSLALPTLVSQP